MATPYESTPTQSPEDTTPDAAEATAALNPFSTQHVFPGWGNIQPQTPNQQPQHTRHEDRRQLRSETWKGHISKWIEHRYKRLQITGEPVFQIPYPRQFIVDGVLQQTNSGSHYMDSLDLFWDLVFVGAIQKTAHTLISEVGGDLHKRENEGSSTTSIIITGDSVGYFALFFATMWKIWSMVDRWSQIFGSNDIVHRLLIVWEMSLVIVMGSEIYHIIDDSVLFISCYCLSRLTITLFYAACLIHLPMFRGDLLFMISMQSVPTAIWFGSIWINDDKKWIIYVIAACFEFFEPLILWVVVKLFNIMKCKWRYHFAINVHHTAKRYGEFIMLTLGEYVLGSFIQGSGKLDDRIGRQVLGMLIVASIHWIYFHCEGSHQTQHALLRSYLSSFLWRFIHVPLSGLLTAGCFAMSKIASLSNDEDPDIPGGLVWTFTVGIGGSIILLTFLGLTHRSLDDLHYTHISKPVRLVIRGSFGCGIVLMGLSRKSIMGSIYLPAIVTGMCVFLVAIEMIGRVQVKSIHSKQNSNNYNAGNNNRGEGITEEDNRNQNDMLTRYPTNQDQPDTWIDSSRQWEYGTPGFHGQIQDIEAPRVSATGVNDNRQSLRQRTWRGDEQEDLTQRSRASAHWRRALLATRIGIQIRNIRFRQYNVSDVPGSVPM